MQELTPNEQRCLEALGSKPKTLEELTKAMQAKSELHVRFHLRALKEKGYIKWSS